MGTRRPAVAAAACALLLSCGGPPRGATGGASSTAEPMTAAVTAATNPTHGTTTVVTHLPLTTVASVPKATVATKCGAGTDRGALTVLAASSMANVLSELKDAWVDAHPCVTALNISYGSSATLAAQIINGAPADAFISASDSTMNTVGNAGLAVIPPRVFARNKAIIMMWPKSQFVTKVNVITDLLDSANPGIKVGLCVASAPCGSLANTVLANARTAYARADLTRAGIADTETPSVEDLVTKVELGELDAGIVYVSDCSYAEPRGLATCTELPDSANSSNNYLVAGLNSRATTAAFVDWVMSQAFGTVARTKYGFLLP